MTLRNRRTGRTYSYDRLGRLEEIEMQTFRSNGVESGLGAEVDSTAESFFQRALNRVSGRSGYRPVPTDEF